MQYEITEQRLQEQKSENRFLREEVIPGLNGANLIEYFGAVGLFACSINGKIFACDP